MQTNDLYYLVQEAYREGGSPYGVSFWTECATSEVRAVAAMERKGERESCLPIFANTSQLNALRVGTAYHLLMEYEEKVPHDFVWDLTDSCSLDFWEAMRLYSAYQNRWGNVREKWGFTQVVRERDLPLDPAGIYELGAGLYDLPRGTPVTGRADLVGYVPKGAIAGVEERTGIELPGAGWYILDFKTAGPKWKVNHTLKAQASNYLILGGRDMPHGVKGIIFDEITKEAEPLFRHSMLPYERANREKVRDLILKGLKNLNAAGFSKFA